MTTSSHGAAPSLERLARSGEVPELCFPAPPRPACEISVVIPVKDEHEGIEATLAALERQVELDGSPFPRERYEVLVLANNCRDDSAALVRRFARRRPSLALHVAEVTLPPTEAHVGRARRLLMDAAYRRLSSLRPGGGVIASTDGDTLVAPDWLAAILSEVRSGADAVGGRILTRAEDRARLGAATRLYLLRDTMYRALRAEAEALLDPASHDTWPRHFQHFGANLALTTAIYARAGGVPSVPYLEDQALYDALERIDARVRHSPSVRVLTSTRRVSRAAVGFGEFLSHLDDLQGRSEAQLVEDAAYVVAQIHARRELRERWRAARGGDEPPRRALLSLGERLGLPAPRLRELLATSAYFGLALDRIRTEADPDAARLRPRLVEITEAIAALRESLAPLRPRRLPSASAADQSVAASVRSKRSIR